MFDMTDLYQQLILDHNRTPRNRRRIEHAGRRAEGYNPLCGDRITVFLTIGGDVIEEAAFEGTGCAISTAAASMMTETVMGMSIAEATALFERFREMVTADIDSDNTDAAALGKLGAFAGVRRFPARVKCATLAWHTLRAAIVSDHEVVSTE